MILLGITAAFIGLAVISPKSKSIFKIILVLMWIIYGLNTYSGDYVAYESVYRNISYYGLTHYEILFSALMFLFSKAGIPFICFRMFLATIYVILLDKIILRYSDYPALACALGLVFPFTYYVSVVRAGIAAMIMLYAVHWLYGNTRKNNVRFIIAIVIATLFHYSSIVFLVFWFVRNGINYKKFLYVILGTCVIAYAYSHLDIMTSLISHFSVRAKTLQWFSASSNLALNWKGIGMQLLIVIGNIAINLISKRIMERTIICADDKSELLEFRVWLSNISYYASVTIIMFVPFMFVNDVAMRFEWAVLILTICSCLNSSYAVKMYSSTDLRRSLVPTIELLLVAFIIIIVVYANLPYIGTENSAVRIFFNNLISF